MKRGGKRKGAGRPKLKKSQKKEPTKVMRIPHSKIEDVKKIIKHDRPIPFSVDQTGKYDS